MNFTKIYFSYRLYVMYLAHFYNCKYIIGYDFAFSKVASG